MAHQLRIQVTLQSVSGLVENNIVNTWYCDGGLIGDSPADVANDFVGKLTTFYQDIDGLLSGDIVETALWKAYNLSDPEPRVAVALGTWSLSLPSGNPGLPTECCIVLSFHGAFASGESRARRRGRIFLGPLRRDVVETADGNVRVTTAKLDVIKNAADALQAGNDVDSAWAIYSQALVDDGETIADATNDVTGGWVDNAIDIQRRRGVRPTVRHTFS